jgi:hypothetical protein
MFLDVEKRVGPDQPEPSRVAAPPAGSGSGSAIKIESRWIFPSRQKPHKKLPVLLTVMSSLNRIFTIQSQGPNLLNVVIE